MPLMTIAEARELAPGELEIGDEHVARAEAEADAAEQRAAEMADSAIEGGKQAPAATAVVEAHATAEIIRQRAARIRDKADRAAAANRLLALEAVGRDVEAIHAAAAQPDAGMVAALTAITNAYATLSQLAEAHNTRVRAAVQQARELGAERAAPSGPRASSAHVTVHQGNRKVQSGGNIVQLVDRRTIDDAVELAIKGDIDAGVRRLSAAHTVAPPVPAERYFIGPNGIVDPVNEQSRELAKQIANGTVRILTAEERAAYLDGRLHGGHQAQA
jgi:hypothetical protein